MPGITIRTLLVAGLLALLTGCGTPVSRSATASEIAQKAVVIFSISHDIEFQTGAYAIVYMDGEDMRTRVVIKSLQDGLAGPVSSDFADRRGHLYVLEVDPGLHRFDGWHVYSAGVRIFRKEPAENLRFEVKKGDVLYLGNIHSRLVDGHWVLGGRSANGGFPMVVDRSDQDIPLAEEKIPALKGKVHAALLPLGPWVHTPENIKRVNPIYMPPPLKK